MSGGEAAVGDYRPGRAGASAAGFGRLRLGSCAVVRHEDLKNSGWPLKRTKGSKRDASGRHHLNGVRHRLNGPVVVRRAHWERSHLVGRERCESMELLSGNAAPLVRRGCSEGRFMGRVWLSIIRLPWPSYRCRSMKFDRLHPCLVTSFARPEDRLRPLPKNFPSALIPRAAPSRISGDGESSGRRYRCMRWPRIGWRRAGLA